MGVYVIYNYFIAISAERAAKIIVPIIPLKIIITTNIPERKSSFEINGGDVALFIIYATRSPFIRARRVNRSVNNKLLPIYIYVSRTFKPIVK